MHSLVHERRAETARLREELLSSEGARPGGEGGGAEAGGGGGAWGTAGTPTSQNGSPRGIRLISKRTSPPREPPPLPETDAPMPAIAQRLQQQATERYLAFQKKQQEKQKLRQWGAAAKAVSSFAASVPAPQGVVAAAQAAANAARPPPQVLPRPPSNRSEEASGNIVAGMFSRPTTSIKDEEGEKGPAAA